MPPLSHHSVTRALPPLPLPVNEGVDAITLDHDSINGEVQGDLLKGLKIPPDLLLEMVTQLTREQEGIEPGEVLSGVGFPESLDRVIDTLVSGVVFRILRGFLAGAAPGHGYDAEQAGEHENHVREATGQHGAV